MYCCKICLTRCGSEVRFLVSGSTMFRIASSFPRRSFAIYFLGSLCRHASCVSDLCCALWAFLILLWMACRVCLRLCHMSLPGKGYSGFLCSTSRRCLENAFCLGLSGKLFRFWASSEFSVAFSRRHSLSCLLSLYSLLLVVCLSPPELSVRKATVWMILINLMICVNVSDVCCRTAVACFRVSVHVCSLIGPLQVPLQSLV